jgi:hypothetical protein
MVNKKIKLYSIGNEENFNYYEFDKTNRVIKILSKIFSELFKTDIHIYQGYENKKGKWVDKKINFEKRKDFHEVISYKIDNKPRIDIFYGNKKMFITINCTDKEKLKFNDALGKSSIMPKPKKLPKYQKKIK